MSDAATNATPAAAPEQAAAPTNAATTANPGDGAQPDANPAPATPRAKLLRLADFDDDAEIEGVKVNGQPQRVKVRDWVAERQRDMSATQRYQEASRLRDEANARAQALTQALSDPIRFRNELSALGINPRDLAERVLQAELDDAALSPDERKHKQLKAEIAEMERQQAEAQQRQVEAQAAAFREKAAAWFGQRMDEAGVAANPGVRDMVLAQMVPYYRARLAAVQQGREAPITPEEMQHVARESYRQLVGSWRDVLTPDDRRAMIADDDWAWYEQQRAAKAKQVVPAAAPRTEQPRRENGQYDKARDGAPARRVVSDGDWETMFRR